MLGLLRYAKDYRKQIILGPFFKFLEAVFELVLPLQMATLVDEGLRQNNWSKVVEMTLWMIAMSVIGMICAVICQYYASVASQGFGTELAESGNISGGQKQRIALARVILVDSPVMILDESTSNLDVLTEKKIIDNLMQLTEKTIIFVSHRLIISQRAERILTM